MRGRTVVKRYGVIFTCLCIRAVHIEVAHSLDTDACINAVRRFVARRGLTKLICSDNGSNLVAIIRTSRERVVIWIKTEYKIHCHRSVYNGISIKQKKTIEVNDMVLIVDKTPKNYWCLGRVVYTNNDKFRLVRNVYLKTQCDVLMKPVHKVCLLIEANIL